MKAQKIEANSFINHTHTNASATKNIITVHIIMVLQVNWERLNGVNICIHALNVPTNANKINCELYAAANNLIKSLSVVFHIIVKIAIDDGSHAKACALLPSVLITITNAPVNNPPKLAMINAISLSSNICI